MTTYGQKGGQGPNQGKSAETLKIVVEGDVYLKKVYGGQRWLYLGLHGFYRPLLIGFHTEDDALSHKQRVEKMSSEYTSYVLLGEVV